MSLSLIQECKPLHVSMHAKSAYFFEWSAVFMVPQCKKNLIKSLKNESFAFF